MIMENVEYDVVILAGQSNAEGSGVGDVESAFTPNDKIRILEDQNKPLIHFDSKGILQVDGQLSLNIIEAKEQLNAKNQVLGNFSLSFASEYVKAGCLQGNRKLLIVYAAVGGTGFSRNQWGRGAVLQERMFAMVDYALSLHAGNKVVAFLWHQGEHDAFENPELSDGTREKFYYEKFGDLIKIVKNKYGDMPILAGDFSYEWVNSGYQNQCAAIKRATKKVLKENGGAFIETSDLLSNNQQIGNNDTIHLSRQSLYELGKRYFKAFKKVK